MKNLKNILAVLALTILGATTAYSNTQNKNVDHQYGFQNGACYDYTAAEYVAVDQCASSIPTYYIVNGNCVMTSTGQLMPAKYCMPISNDNAKNAKQCYGTYIYESSENVQYVNCYGSNCKGYTLIQLTTGASVNCQ